ncbi:hypothetical protein CPC08DRAFT_526388 [Agrocybe pediades]|nr:hypothetical protein CPC08DRAFT_526388 [Agrocybe pediades]
MSDNLPRDPPINLLAICPGRIHNGVKKSCGRPMGPLVVYKGKGSPRKRHLRGSLSQTCTDFDCLFTHHHTQAYDYEDALRLLIRHRNPSDPAGYPRDLKPPSPQTPQSSPPSTQQASNGMPASTQAEVGPSQSAGKKSVLHCANPECYTQQKTRTHGNQLCAEKKCKACCAAACTKAFTDGVARNACKAHHQPSVHAVHRPAGTVSAPTASNSLPNPAPPPSHVPSVSQPIPSQAPSLATTLTPPSTQPATAPSAPPQPTQTQSSSQRTASLAKAVTGTWKHKRDHPTEENAQGSKTLKVQEMEMMDRQRRTCTMGCLTDFSGISQL